MLSVAKPQNESPCAAQKRGSSEKPARFRQGPQAHQKHSEHHDQPNWMGRETARTVPPDLTDLSWTQVGIVRGGLPPTVHGRAH